jgi:hypothetical protein
MLARKINDLQILLPQQIRQQLVGIEYFDVHIQNGQLILKPIANQVDKVRQKLEALGINESHLEEAIQWARQNLS